MPIISACIRNADFEIFNKIKLFNPDATLTSILVSEISAFRLDDIGVKPKKERRVAVPVYMSVALRDSYREASNGKTSMSLIFENYLRRWLSGMVSLGSGDDSVIGYAMSHIATVRIPETLYLQYKNLTHSRTPSLAALMRSALDEFVSTGNAPRRAPKHPPCSQRIFKVSGEIKAKYEAIRKANSSITGGTLVRSALEKYAAFIKY